MDSRSRYTSIPGIPAALAYTVPVPTTPPHERDLYRLFASIEDEEEAALLLQDILTPQELASIAERWQLVRALDAGLPQRDIAKKLKISISKITRGSHMLQYGKGGFRVFLERLGKGK
jgi:TrpR family transcriptional regulator, trp operon repressor